MWEYDGYGKWTAGRREVNTIAPGLFQARFIRTHRGLSDIVDTTNYGSVADAKSAANRLAANDAWTESALSPRI